MTDDRLEKMKQTMAAQRAKAQAGASAKAAEEAEKQQAAADAAAAWSGIQVMMRAVVDDINAELGEDDHKLQLKIGQPMASNRLGQGEVAFRSSPGSSDMSFNVWSESGDINIRVPKEREAKNLTFPLVELDKDKWRALLYEYMEARLGI